MLIELTSFIFPLWSGIYLGTKNKEIPLVLEVNRASDILQALRLKKEFDLDLVLMSVEEAPLVLDQIQASGVSVIIDPMDNIPDSFDELASNTYHYLELNISSKIGSYQNLYSASSDEENLFLGISDYVYPDTVQIYDSNGDQVRTLLVGTLPGDFAIWKND